MAKQPTQKVITKKHMARLERERLQQRYLLIGAGVVIILVVGLILYGVLDQLVFQNLRPVAKVSDETITTAEFQKAVRFDRYRSIQQLRQIVSDQMMLQFFGSYVQQISTRLNSPATLGQEVIDGLIEDILVAKEAETRGITVSDQEAQKEFEQAFGFYENGTPTPTITPTNVTFSTSTLSPTQLALVPPTATPVPTEIVTETSTPEVTNTPDTTATLEAAAIATSEVLPTITLIPTITLTPTITPTPTPYTRELFQDELATFLENTKDIGLSETDLRTYIRKQVLRRKVYEAVAADVKPAAEFLWARHILVASEEEAKQVESRLRAGEDFAALALELSTDESNKASGGDLGWFARGRMVKEFEEAAYKLSIGEISPPVQTEFGYHIIQLLGREERPLDSQQLDQAKQQAYQDWLTKAKEAANIETFADHWTSIVPTDPEIPPDVQSALTQFEQLQQQQQQQQP